MIGVVRTLSNVANKLAVLEDDVHQKEIADAGFHPLHPIMLSSKLTE
jgi:hypothetical protein